MRVLCSMLQVLSYSHSYVPEMPKILHFLKFCCSLLHFLKFGYSLYISFSNTPMLKFAVQKKFISKTLCIAAEMGSTNDIMFASSRSVRVDSCFFYHSLIQTLPAF